MAQVLVRDLEQSVVDSLKARAKEHRRSLQAELRWILECAASHRVADPRAPAAAIRRSLGGKPFSDSTEIIREDRER